MKKKVLVVFGNIAYFGQERANVELFKSLKDELDPLFLTHHKWGKLHIQTVLTNENFKWEKMRFVAPFRKKHNIKTWIINFYRIITTNIDLLKYYIRYKPDYVHFANDFFFITLIPALLFIRKPIIFNILDRPLHHYKIYSFLWKRFIIKKVHHFACVSKFIKKDLLKIGCKEDKISVVYSLIPERKKDYKDVDLPFNDNFRIVYFGQVIKIKGIDVLIESAIELLKKYEDMEFVIAGSLHYTNKFANEKITQIQNLKLDNKIKLIGFTENIPDLLSKSNLHVVPSIKEEPLGIVVLEAKKASIPSIIFNSGGLPEMIEHKKNGYICENKTASDLTAAIEFFYKSKQICKEYGVNAKQSLSDLPIDNKQFIKKWFEIYNLGNLLN